VTTGSDLSLDQSSDPALESRIKVRLERGLESKIKVPSDPESIGMSYDTALDSLIKVN
jgi:hypothetical protein